MKCGCKTFIIKIDEYPNIRIKNLKMLSTIGSVSFYLSSLDRPRSLITIHSKTMHFKRPERIYAQGFSAILEKELSNPTNRIDKDIYCQHDNIFLTKENLEDLELLLKMSTAAVLSYFKKLGFLFIRETI